MEETEVEEFFLLFLYLDLTGFLSFSFDWVFSAEENIVTVVVEEEKVAIPLPRASVVPFPQKVGRAAHQFQAHVGHQLDHIRDKTGPQIQSLVQHSKEHVQHQIAQSVPHIQNVVKQSKRMAAHVQHELSDLPETKWKELAAALHQGLQKKALVLRGARPNLNPIAQRVQHVRHTILWWIQTVMLESTRLVKQLQQHQLSDMPLQSIRMVRKMCSGQPKAIPFFCDEM